MTYGEACFEEHSSLALVDGNFIQTVYIRNKPKPMSHSDAVKYYNKRLFKHWVHDYNYDKRLSVKRRKELVSAFMFGSSQKYKELM